MFEIAPAKLLYFGNNSLRSSINSLDEIALVSNRNTVVSICNLSVRTILALSTCKLLDFGSIGRLGAPLNRSDGVPIMSGCSTADTLIASLPTYC